VASGSPDWWARTIGEIPLTFLDLTDTPTVYNGKAGLVPEVNAAEDALVWSGPKLSHQQVMARSYWGF